MAVAVSIVARDVHKAPKQTVATHFIDIQLMLAELSWEVLETLERLDVAALGRLQNALRALVI